AELGPRPSRAGRTIEPADLTTVGIVGEVDGEFFFGRPGRRDRIEHARHSDGQRHPHKGIAQGTYHGSLSGVTSISSRRLACPRSIEGEDQVGESRYTHGSSNPRIQSSCREIRQRAGRPKRTLENHSYTHMTPYWNNASFAPSRPLFTRPIECE